ncbi:MAG: trehalose-6-phosphate synthase [Candidatus Muirbacterium halophilum]|nr:trehalose-6-phosphate synthase [Candidatus Muirbacterium halophilum]MCK9474370.1 trehalose-6-phosphate synthase [Candidatus Muirbacterium halophilum]
MSEGRLIIVSNRLPVVIDKKKDGSFSISAGKGGLVTAMAPVLKNRGGVWIGWPGIIEEDGITEQNLGELISKGVKDSGYELEPIILTKKERDNYYEGFSNEIIWPLFHDLISLCNFKDKYWETYLSVNKKISNKIMSKIIKDDFIWVHDYHLLNVASELRQKGYNNRIGFFLHIPFPSLDIFSKLPWRKKILESLLEYDLIGFQTPRDKRNFLQCVRRILRNKVQARGRENLVFIKSQSRDVLVGSFPISIDYEAFKDGADSANVAERAWFLHENLPNRKLILGIDRLDYTKGIPFKLKAFARALEKYPDMQKKVSLVQILVPSRVYIPKYKELKDNIERMVGEINGRFTELGWVPIYYIFRSLKREELLAYYRTSEIALVTPLKDGMNLVVKEFCAANIEETGIVILSEFAGASAQLGKECLLVNPFDVEKTADTIYEAYKMDYKIKRKKMKKMRNSIKKYDIFWWVDNFIKAGVYQSYEEYIPIKDFDFDY